MKIAIDIGHARGTGAQGNGKEEHAVCSDIAAELLDVLAARGHVCYVVDFPEMSNRDDLVATVREINHLAPDFSLSLHCDASDHPDAHGAHVCYTSASGKALASHISKPLCALLPGRAQPIMRRTDLYVLNKTRCPAVLVECGFITHKDDCRIVTQRKEAVASAIAQGIDVYALELKKKS